MESDGGPDWLLYEHQMVERHAAAHPDADVFHWTHVPEPMLEESGYIHDRNQWRLERKRKHDDPNPLSDYGLDGLARVGPDEFHGLQAKRRKAGSYLRAADLGSFQMVVARLRTKCPKSRGIVYTDARLTRELADDVQLLDSYTVVHMPLVCVAPTPEVVVGADLVPWPHQVEALEALAEWDGQLGALVMPPGSGKTMVMGAWGRNHHRVVVCSPTRALAAQTLETMGRLMPDHRRLLVDCDATGTRDADDVASAWADDRPLLVSTTYVSMRDIISPLVSEGTVVMIDEAHHVIDRLSETVELIERTACRVLLVTGTPPAALMDDDYEEVDLVYQYDYDRAVRDGRICDYCIYLPEIVDPVGDTDHDDLVRRLGNDMVGRCHFIANGMLRTGSTRCIIYAGTCEEAAAYNEAIVSLANKFHGISAWSGVITGDVSTVGRAQLLADFQQSGSTRWYFLCSVRVLDEGIDVPTCDAVYIGQSVGNQARFVQRMCRANRLDYKGKVASVLVWTDNDDLDATLRSTAAVARSLGRAAAHVERVSTDYAGPTVCDATLADRVTVLCVSAAERWSARLEQTEAFIVSTGRLPRMGSKDPAEKRLGTWVSDQKRNYAAEKCIMKTVEVRVEWAVLVGRYPREFETTEETWRRLLEATETFVLSTGRLPSNSAKDPVEKRLGTWVSNQKKNYTAETYIMKTAEVRAEWAALFGRYPDAFETAKETWRRSLEATEAFVLQNGRPPSYGAKDPAEKRLGSWVSTQRTNYAAEKQIMKTPDTRAEWEAMIGRHPEALRTAEETWRRAFQETEAFLLLTGRLPSQKAQDPAEKQLGTWVSNQKINYAAERYIMKTAKVQTEWAALIGRHPEAFETTEETWRRSLDETEAFVLSTGRLPRSKSKDPTERRLGAWVSNQKSNYAAENKSMKTVEVRAEWAALVGRHSEAFETTEETWRRSLEATEAFVLSTGRLPSASAKDPAEKRLSNWVLHQKKNYTAETYIMKTAEVRAEWAALVGRHPQAFETAEETWRRSLEATEAFVLSTGRLPSTTAREPTEKRLGNWIGTQKKNYAAEKERMKTAEVRAEWTALVGRHSEAFESAEETWRRSLEATEAFVLSTGRLPSQKAKDPAEKRLGSWVSNQKSSYAAEKNIMKTPEVRAEWAALIGRYPEAFESAEETWRRSLEATEAFLLSTGRLPSTTAKDPTEKRLGQWVSNQKSSYAAEKRIMKTPEVRAEWAALVGRHPALKPRAN